MMQINSVIWRRKAPAKLNISLEVLARRADGFHEIETLMTSIDLVDSLTFRPNRTGQIDFRYMNTIRYPGSFDSVPVGDDNLAVRALRLIQQRYGVEQGGELELVKRIPAAAGLGGGSSDAAAALLLGNAGWGLNQSLDELAPIAAELGSDVPFFLRPIAGTGGAAVCRGRGEIIENLSTLGRLHFVITKPNAGLSTADVFAHCRPADAPRGIGDLVESLRRGDLAVAAKACFNRLTDAAVRLAPEVKTLLDRLGRWGCLAWQMSGSGTSCFGLCAHRKEAQRAAAWMRGQGYWSMAVSTG